MKAGERPPPRLRFVSRKATMANDCDERAIIGRAARFSFRLHCAGRQQALEIGEDADLTASPHVVKQAALSPSDHRRTRNSLKYSGELGFSVRR